MPGRKTLLLLAASLLLPACVTFRAPRGWLASAEVEAQQAYGGWMSIWLNQTGGPPELEGELLVIDSDTAWVLTLGGEVLPFATGDILKARLEIYDPGLAKIRLVVFVGILSTISHGMAVMLTMPAWVLGGWLIDWSAARSAVVDVQKTPWENLKVHARYPQGLPPGFKSEMIDPKPL